MIGSVLDLAILGLLKEHPMHGYDLRKRLREELGPFSQVSFGSLYPALGRLERLGAVEALTIEGQRLEQPRPDSSAGGESLLARRATARAAAALGGRGTRARKVYEITEPGKLMFEDLLEATDAGDDPRSFLLRLGFARHLTTPARQRLLERRRAQLLDRVERAHRLLATRHDRLDRYGLSILEHSLELASADLAWVERLLGEEMGPGTAVGDPGRFTVPARVATGETTEATGKPPETSDGAATSRSRARGDGVPGAAGGPVEYPVPTPATSPAAGVDGTLAAPLGTAAQSAGGIAGILHAGRLRRRPDGSRPVPQQPRPQQSNRRKEQIGQ
jgi:DNA-binding PadR family transcriptional regulator